MLARLDVSLSRDRENAIYQGRLRLARYLWSQYPKIGYLEAHGLALPPELDRRFRAAGPFVRTQDRAAFLPFADAIPAELVTPIACAGTPEDVATQLRAVFDAGADGVMAVSPDRARRDDGERPRPLRRGRRDAPLGIAGTDQDRGFQTFRNTRRKFAPSTFCTSSSLYPRSSRPWVTRGRCSMLRNPSRWSSVGRPGVAALKRRL